MQDRMKRDAEKNNRPVRIKGASNPPIWNNRPPSSGPIMRPIPKKVSRDAY
jgi:hypothetical protein